MGEKVVNVSIDAVNDDSSSSYEPEYEVETVTISTGKIKLQVLSVVPPPLEYMSALHSRKEEISGRQVWAGSLVLANVLCQGMYKGMFDDKQILELGSGTGLLGMAIVKVSRNCQVTLTDGDPLAIELLQQNLQNPDNGLDPAAIQSTLLLWSEAINQGHEFCRWCRKTWSKPEADAIRFDYILAGDVLYKDALPSLFFATVRSLLADNGVLFLCHVPRANVNHEVVLKAAMVAGFSCEDEGCLDLAALGEGECSMDDLNRARVYKMSLQ
ncbi:hypothetical protein MPSEU_000210800 [Mayamaea pseudoterrestris]|nr:hypothetical protein MPSEU_000210800 [Mayamaea pseudoterrestris]